MRPVKRAARHKETPDKLKCLTRENDPFDTTHGCKSKDQYNVWILAWAILVCATRSILKTVSGIIGVEPIACEAINELHRSENTPLLAWA